MYLPDENIFVLPIHRAVAIAESVAVPPSLKTRKNGLRLRILQNKKK